MSIYCSPQRLTTISSWVFAVGTKAVLIKRLFVCLMGTIIKYYVLILLVFVSIANASSNRTGNTIKNFVKYISKITYSNLL